MAMSNLELAAALGLTPAVISRNRKAGMPVTSIEAAMAWRSANVRARVSCSGRSATAVLPARPVPDAARPTARPAVAEYPLHQTADEPSYEISRSRREAAEAALAQLKLAELAGELVRADDWAAALAKRAAAFREGLLQIPARLSAQFAAETNQATIHALLDAEIRQVMHQLIDQAHPTSPDHRND